MDNTHAHNPCAKMFRCLTNQTSLYWITNGAVHAHQNLILLKEFYAQHEDVIFKPLDGMGGSSIFRILYFYHSDIIKFQILRSSMQSTLDFSVVQLIRFDITRNQ